MAAFDDEILARERQLCQRVLSGSFSAKVADSRHPRHIWPNGDFQGERVAGLIADKLEIVVRKSRRPPACAARGTIPSDGTVVDLIIAV